MRPSWHMIKLIPKQNHWPSRLIDRLLRIISFGKMHTYVSDYATTWGEKIYTPVKWNSLTIQQRNVILAHEQVHVDQYKRFGKVLMTLIYIAPLPIFLAYGRYRIELEAFKATANAMLREYGPGILEGEGFANWTAEQLGGPSYIWAWPFKKSIKKKMMAYLAELLNKS